MVLPGEPRAGGAGETWLQRLRTALPEELRPHLLDVLEKTDGLVLFAGSAAWAGRLKLALPELAEAAGNRRLTVRLEARGRATRPEAGGRATRPEARGRARRPQ